MQIDLTGKTAIVTGASSGMGAATARLMAAAGAQVAVVGRDEQRLGETHDAIVEAGGSSLKLTEDLADTDAIQRIVDAAVAEFGGLDILVHSAGLFEAEAFADSTLGCLERQWQVNTRAPFWLTHLALPHMRDGGSIVFLSSTVAHTGFPGISAYSATKGAVEAFARSIAAELAPRLRVNILAPGFVLTPMVKDQFPGNPAMEQWLKDTTPLGFVGEPEHIAQAVSFLASDASAYTHGATLVVDGGWTGQARG
jgi:NAD(P)-dependent dehydrogenase (short-subunit alcohol dehydrogenase family)